MGYTRTFVRTYGRHQDEELKRVCEVYMFYFGDHSDIQIRDIINGLYDSSGAYESGRKWIIDYRTQVQSGNLSFLKMANLRATKLMIEDLGDGDLAAGIEAWLQASQDDREALVVELFDEARITICADTFGMELNSVTFCVIFHHPNKIETRKWRNFVRTKFVNLLTLRVVKYHTILLPEVGGPAFGASKRALENY